MDDKDPPTSRGTHPPAGGHTHQQGDTPTATVSEKSSLKRQISEQPMLKKSMATYISDGTDGSSVIVSSVTASSVVVT